MSKYKNKYKLGNFDVLVLNADNNYSVNLSTDFVSTKYMSYNIFTLPTINKAELPNNLLGFRLEETTFSDTYSCKLYTTQLQESTLYTSNTSFFMYTGLDLSQGNSVYSLKTIHMYADNEGNLYNPDSFIIEDVKNTLRFSNTDEPKEIVSLDVTILVKYSGKNRNADFYFCTKDGHTQKRIYTVDRIPTPHSFHFDTTNIHGYIYFSHNLECKAIDNIVITYADGSQMSIPREEFIESYHGEECPYLSGGRKFILKRYQKLNTSWSHRKDSLNGFHPIPMVITNNSSFDNFTKERMSCVITYIDTTDSDNTINSGPINMCSYFFDLLQNENKYPWVTYSIGDKIIDNFIIDYSRTDEYPFMPLYIPVNNRYDKLYNDHAINYFSFLESEAVETLNRTCTINVATWEVL